MSPERINFVVNATLFQICWFACVIGGAKGVIWPAILSFSALAIFQLRPSRRAKSDLKLLFASLVLALIVDSTWIHLGWIKYSTPVPFEFITPLWIALLWMAFSITLNHSLTWINKHPLLAPVLGAMGGVLSYWAGIRLGAVTFHADPILITIGLAIAWAASLQILSKLSD